MTILVTGGLGFIGSAFVRDYLKRTIDIPEDVIILDFLTYAGNLKNLGPYEHDERIKIFVADINNTDVVKDILSVYKPRLLVNFAAETHVDNSIKSSSPFLQTNVLGVVNLLECVKDICPEIIFLHISTDEVYGSLGPKDPPFTENTPYAPRSPYAASKAASDHFVNAYRVTHGLRTYITNCSNNFGPYQHPEKFIPTVIINALNNQKIPIYGSGKNIRDWIYVYDHCRALDYILNEGIIGNRYNIGGGMQMDNLTLAKKILDLLNRSYDLLSFVEDRKGHDFRYDVDTEKIYVHTGWKPGINTEEKFNTRLEQTVTWYRINMDWVKTCQHQKTH
jgi:dTDP-glucose 4,6-dehydratase